MNSKFFKLISIGILLFSLVFHSCNEENEPVPALAVELPAFNKINVAQNITLNIRTGTQNVEISGEGQLNNVIVEVVNEELNIYNPDPELVSNVIANVSLSNLVQLICRENSFTNFPDDFTSDSEVLTILGRNAASIRMNGSFTYDSLYFGLRDASNLAIANLQSRVAVGDLRNGTRCNMEGFTNQLNLVMTDACRFNLDFPDVSLPFGEPIESANCMVTARNGATAWIYPTNLLIAEVSDGSTVYYKGTPTSIEQQLSNGGQLLQKEE